MGDALLQVFRLLGIFVFAVVLTLLTLHVARKYGLLAKARKDRWGNPHHTALFGGTAIFAAFIASLVTIPLPYTPDIIGLLIGAVMMFSLGLIDDIKSLKPRTKLVGQIASIIPLLIGVAMSHPAWHLLWTLPLLFFWALTLSNAINLIDNMDGLSSGTVVLICGSLFAFAYQLQKPWLALLALGLACACLGFLVFNYRWEKPALIYMGDCGSLVLGYLLAAISGLLFYPAEVPTPIGVASQFSLLLLIMAFPLFDTTLVTVIRKREGRPISQGGRDHSSHRLVYAGAKDHSAVLILYSMSIGCGMIAFAVGWLQRPLITLAVLALVVGLLITFGTYLNKHKPPDKPSTPAKPETSPVSAPVAVTYEVPKSPSYRLGDQQ